MAISGEKFGPAVSKFAKAMDSLDVELATDSKVSAEEQLRSFDVQYCLLDNRVGDVLSRHLWSVTSDNQVYLTTLTSTGLGDGPAFVPSAYAPDKDFFRGSFGAKNIMPLWRDAAATEPNVTSGLLFMLSESYDMDVTVTDLAAYAYGLLGTGAYVERFKDDLVESAARLPTRRTATFSRSRPSSAESC